MASTQEDSEEQRELFPLVTYHNLIIMTRGLVTYMKSLSGWLCRTTEAISSRLQVDSVEPLRLSPSIISFTASMQAFCLEELVGHKRLVSCTKKKSWY